MTTDYMFLTLVIAGSCLGIAGFVISCICVAMVAGFTRSTHTVQYVPHDNSDAFQPEPSLVEENEKALLAQVGRKKKDKPTVVEDLDAPIEEIAQTDITF